MAHQQYTSGCPEGSVSPRHRAAAGNQIRLRRLATRVCLLTCRHTYGHKTSCPSSRACLCTVVGSLFLSISDRISWRNFMNHTRDCRTAARGPKGRCGGQVSAEILSSSSMGVENAENIVQCFRVSRSTLLFYLIDHGRSWGRISFPSLARSWCLLTTVCRFLHFSSNTSLHPARYGRPSSACVDGETAPCAARQLNFRALQ